jgi:hypothetical protein
MLLLASPAYLAGSRNCELVWYPGQDIALLWGITS